MNNEKKDKRKRKKYDYKLAEKYLTVGLNYEFEEDAPEDIFEMFDIGDCRDDIGLGDLRYPIKSEGDLLRQLLKHNKIK